MRPREVGVKLKLPFVGEISGSWAPQQVEAKASWELYVELATRISVVPLGRDEGLAREALSSLYTLFATTRRILGTYGPDVSPPSAADKITFGKLALTVLNAAVRPLLAHWHPLLGAWEESRPDGVSPIAHENAWPEIEKLRGEIEQMRLGLLQVAKLLADVAGAAPLTADSRLLGDLRKERGGGECLTLGGEVLTRGLVSGGGQRSWCAVREFDQLFVWVRALRAELGNAEFRNGKRAVSLSWSTDRGIS
ncbi:hypothetical protein [Amycolatopsis sulphurea]|uniref:hypothetical protein n=1 Tax=Amycolatopsis sulphurea TaxID=76022 RepID=UPI001B808BE3|nr:hypothetical protein [Amycolatopsis sulphurea]